MMPKLKRVIETALYVDDLERAADFYLNILGLRRLFRDNRLQAFSVGGKNVLLLFRRGASLKPLACQAAQFRLTMAAAHCTSHSRSRPKNCLRGKLDCSGMKSPSRAAPNGRAAVTAFIFEIPTGISWSSLPRVCGKFIDRGLAALPSCD